MKWRINSKGKAKCFSFSIYVLSLQSLREKYSFYYGMILKEDKTMITFIVTLITLLSLAAFAAVLILVGGTGFVIAFGDVIVCGLIILLIIRFIIKRRK